MKIKKGDTVEVISGDDQGVRGTVHSVCPHCNKPTRVGYRVAPDGSKARICRKCEETID